MIVLGIETSCDDTSLALYSGERGVIAHYTSSQLVHAAFGGVVPELASRAHIQTILPVFNEILDLAHLEAGDIDAVGVSNGPGLIGSLLVGAAFAKALALGLDIPLAGVHHIESHIMANELQGDPLVLPCLALIVSGGHSVIYEVQNVGIFKMMGSSRDDAAGEAFDKIAKLLNLGYPGGPALERAAKAGDSAAAGFPRAMLASGDYDFSFSGLKTAVRLHVERSGKLSPGDISDIAASAQKAIVDPLISKTISCAKTLRIKNIYMAGGVAANTILRDGMRELCELNKLIFNAPPIEYCTDNGAMVACAAHKHISYGRRDDLGLDVFARGPIRSWR